MKPILFLVFSALTLSCATDQKEAEEKQEINDFHLSYDTPKELTQYQQAAFDALDMLQVNSDEQSRIYSTFPNIEQPCYPPDTSFTISSADLLLALNKLVSEHFTNLVLEERDSLAATAVLAQEEYLVLHCPSYASDVNYEDGLPLNGTWVLPSVLGHRDVILVW